MVDGDNAVAEQNMAQVRYFCREFSSKLQERVSVGVFVSIIMFHKVVFDIARFSQQSSPFYSVCISVFWCYICLSSRVANVAAFMTAIACKLHIIVFKNRLSEPGNGISTLYLHHRLLEAFLGEIQTHFVFVFFISKADEPDVLLLGIAIDVWWIFQLAKGFHAWSCRFSVSSRDANWFVPGFLFCFQQSFIRNGDHSCSCGCLKQNASIRIQR